MARRAFLILVDARCVFVCVSFSSIILLRCVEFATGDHGKRASRTAETASNHHLAVRKQRRRMKPARGVHTAGGCPDARGRVIQFSAAEAVIDWVDAEKPACSQDLSIAEQRGGVA